MNILKQSTAATIKLGAFVDDSDGKTAETGLTISQADIRLSKNGGDFAQTHNSAGATHDEFGYYDIPLDTTDTNTLGRLRVSVSKSGALPVWQDFMVVTANIYDTLCSTASLNVNVASLSTDAITAASLKADAITEIQNGLATAAALSVVDDFVDELESRLTASRAGYLDKLNVAGDLANTSNANSFKADVSGLATASALAAVDDLVDELESRLTAIRAGYLDKLNVSGILANTDNANLFKADVSGLATAAALATVNSYVDELESRLTAARATYLDKLNVAGTLANTSNADTFKADVTKLDATVSSRLAAADYTDPDNAGITAIKAKTDNLPAIPAPANEYDTELAAIQADLNNPDQYKADVSGIPAAVWAYTTRTLSSFGTLVSNIWAHATRTLSAFGFTVATQSDANVTAIKAKTDNLPASPAPAGEYDTELASIQADLDNPNQYKADVSGLATTTHLQEVEDKVDTADTVVDAIKAKTDNLPANPAPAGEYDIRLTAIQTDLDNPNQYKADVSALSKTTHVQEVEDKVDAVKLKTDNIPANPAIAGEYTARLIAIQADLDDPAQYQADVSGIPDAILAKVIVDTLTVEQVLKVLAAVETGVTTGGGTDTIVYTGKDGTTIQLTGVDLDGNRTAVIVTPGA